MNCNILWNTLSLEEWQSRFNKIVCSNYLQSYHYAQAIAKTHQQRARWGLIMMGDQEAGLVQMLEVRTLWGLFHGLMIDRGPLWFEGFGNAVHIKLFFDEINQQFPRRFGRKRRFIPEVEGGPAAQQILSQTGLVKNLHATPYETLWWDLSLDETQAHTALKGNWRGSLKKAEAANITLSWDQTGRFFPDIKGIYAADKALRGYGGVSPKLLDNIAVFSTPDQPMVIGKATRDDEMIAFVVFLTHGRSATYQVGWSSDQGRQCNAHHLLLWRGRSVLKSRGVQELDLGGINDKTAAGIKRFKEGTNAKNYSLIGHYS